MDVFSILGTIAFTISGYLVGVRKRLDVLGIIILSLMTAVGGGIIRDAIVGRVPLVFHENLPLLVIAETLLIGVLLRLHQREYGFLRRLFVIADSIGLVAFSMTGAAVGLAYHLNGFGVISLGFITAVGGGMVRDMMVNDIPFILNRDFYGTVSILVAGSLYVLTKLDLDSALALHVLFVGGLAIRLLAHRRELVLPRLAKHGSRHDHS